MGPEVSDVDVEMRGVGHGCVRSDRPVSAIDDHDRAGDVNRQSEARKIAGPTMSSAAPARRTRVVDEGLREFRIAPRTVAFNGVSISRGRSHPRARLPCRARRQAPCETEHAVLRGGLGRRTRCAQMDEGLDRADIDDPSLAARYGSRKAYVTLKTPFKLIAMMSSASLITASLAPSMPLRRALALLTRIETCPIFSAICLATANSPRVESSRGRSSPLFRRRPGFPWLPPRPPSRSCQLSPSCVLFAGRTLLIVRPMPEPAPGGMICNMIWRRGLRGFCSFGLGRTRASARGDTRQ